ncbi:MAG: AI-2E family transporter [Clostridiales bacterium]|nr:AI-2E family transporter [Clostridiales bacterium]
MKRFKGDSKYTRIAIYVIITGALLMIISKLISSSENLWTSFVEFSQFLYKAIKPLVVGLILAYILLPVTSSIEKGLGKIFKKPKFKKFIRTLSLIFVYLLVVALVIGAIYFIIPSVVENIAELFNNIPEYYETVSDWYVEQVAPSELINNEYTQSAIEKGITTFNEKINEYLLIGISGIATFTYSIVTGLITAVIALIISFYVVAGRRRLGYEVESTANAYFGEKRTSSVKEFLKSVDWVFGKYISAKIVQILMVFALCQLAFLIIGVPYSTLMALIVGITNIVPFIGPIIGMIPPVILTLLESPIKSLWVLGSVIVIQAIDAYIFQPYFIGDKMGLSPFWVIVSVIVGGGLFGVWGILLSVPVAAVIKISIKQYIKRRSNKVQADIKA